MMDAIEAPRYQYYGTVHDPDREFRRPRNLKITGRASKLTTAGNALAVGIETSLADPIVSPLLHPETPVSFLSRRMSESDHWIAGPCGRRTHVRGSVAIPPIIARVFPPPVIASRLVLSNDYTETDACRTVTVPALVAVFPHSMADFTPPITMIVIAVISVSLIRTNVSVPVVPIVMMPVIMAIAFTVGR